MHVILTEQEYNKLISQSKQSESWKTFAQDLEKKAIDIFNAGKKAMFGGVYNDTINYLKEKGLDSEDIRTFMDNIRQRYDIPIELELEKCINDSYECNGLNNENYFTKKLI